MNVHTDSHFKHRCVKMDKGILTYCWTWMKNLQWVRGIIMQKNYSIFRGWKLEKSYFLPVGACFKGTTFNERLIASEKSVLPREFTHSVMLMNIFISTKCMNSCGGHSHLSTKGNINYSKRDYHFSSWFMRRNFSIREFSNSRWTAM